MQFGGRSFPGNGDRAHKGDTSVRTSLVHSRYNYEAHAAGAEQARREVVGNDRVESGMRDQARGFILSAGESQEWP